MKKVKNIISILLVFTLVNVLIGKTVHELFFHHHEVECTAESTQHYHEKEFHEIDLVCSFNFSASLNQQFNTSISHQLYEADRETTFFYDANKRNTYFNTLSLRGPPKFV